MIVGVTGGMGAGKSSVSGCFAAEGALVVDADREGHKILRKPEVIQALAAAFGPDIVDAEGQVIRRELGRRAFSSEANRQRLNAIVRLPLGALLERRAQAALAEAPERPVVIDAALLVEWGDAFCDVLVVVMAPEAVRKARTVARLGISETEAEARMASQLPESEKVRVADYVIVNDGSPPEMQAKARSVWKQILARD